MTYFSMTPAILAALQSAAIAKGSPLTDAERAGIYARFTSTPPAAPAVATFTHTVAEMLAANAQWLDYVAAHDAAIVNLYAAQPAATAPPIRVRKNLKIADGYHRLLAAKQRGDTTIVCVAASLTEELSF